VMATPGTAINVIPAEARARFNVRYNDLWTRSRLEATLREVIDDGAEKAGARITLTFSGTGDVFLTKPGQLVGRMVAAVEAVTGRTPKLTTGGGTSDARFIQAMCPVIEFGLVNATIHQVDECVSSTDLEQLTRIYTHLLAAEISSPIV
jgi:succinyl-diaminopimelate desuccinylase